MSNSSLLHSYLQDRFKAGVNTDLNKDKGYQSYQKELDKQRKIQYYQQQFAQSEAQRHAIENRSGLGNLLHYGPGVVKDAAVAVGKGVANEASDLVRPAVQNFKHLTGDTATPDQRKALLSTQSTAQERYARLNPEDKARVDKALETVKTTSAISAGSGVDNRDVQAILAKGATGKELDKSLTSVEKKLNTQARANAGRAAEAASLVVGGGGIAQAAKTGVKQAIKAAVTTTASGAAGGAGSELMHNPEASTQDVLKSAAVGGALGLGGDALAAGANKVFKFGREPVKTTRIPVRDLSTPIKGTLSKELPKEPVKQLKPSDLGYNDTDFRLQFNNGALEDVRSNPNIADAFIKTGSKDPLTLVTQHLADSSTNSEINATINRLLPDIEPRNMKLLKSQIRTTKDPMTVAHALWDAAQRDKLRYLPDNAQGTPLVQKINFAKSSPELEVVNSQLNSLDDGLVIANQTGDKAQKNALISDKTFLENEAVRIAKSNESADILAGVGSGKEKVSKLSQRTETKALENKLTKGFDNKSTYQTLDLGQQANGVVNLMDADYEAAKRIALGQQPAPAGINAESVYIGVQNRAAKSGDVELIRQLAEDSTIPKQASIKGQQIASLRNLDDESPVVALQKVLDARKVSPLNVPRSITIEETQKVTSLAQEVAKAKAAIADGGDRLAYGQARIAYDDYVNGLIESASKKSFKEALKHPADAVINAGGFTKSLVASLDNSALLRQGWKTLFTHPGVWAKSSAKSFADFAKTVGGKNTIDAVRADIMSRPNSLNGMYKRMGVDVFGIKEEAFPISLPGKIPIAGRFFKGSEAAYTGFVQRTRADLADKYLEIAQKSGVDLTSKREVQAIGKLVNSLTSRGHLGRVGERASSVLNNVFFSPRLLKSNFDVLTGHQFQRGVTPFVRKRAARNLLQIAIGSAAALKLASEVTGGKVEWDPRSSNFGKLRIGDTRFDLSGGLGSLITLGARIGTASSKSSTTGEVKRLNSGEFGAQTTLDTVYNFFENKTSPALSVIRDYMKGQTFQGEKPSIATTVKTLTLPLIVSNYNELKNSPHAAAIVPALLADTLGVSTNTYGLESDWNANNTKQVKEFKSKVGKDKFEAANKAFNSQFDDWYGSVSSKQDFWKLPQDKREQLVLSKKDALTNDVMKAQGFVYKPKRDNSSNKLIEELKKY